MVVKRSSVSAAAAAGPKSVVPSSVPGYPLNAEQEFLVFQACITHKPAGVFKHLQMSMILHSLKHSLPGMTPAQLWDYLSGLYNLSRCDALETYGELEEDWQEFELPKAEFEAAIKDMKKAGGGGGQAGEDSVGAGIEV